MNVSIEEKKTEAISRWKNSGSVILCDNATFRDCKTKTIYQAGDWKLVSVVEERGDES